VEARLGFHRIRLARARRTPAEVEEPARRLLRRAIAREVKPVPRREEPDLRRSPAVLRHAVASILYRAEGFGGEAIEGVVGPVGEEDVEVVEVLGGQCGFARRKHDVTPQVRPTLLSADAVAGGVMGVLAMLASMVTESQYRGVFEGVKFIIFRVYSKTCKIPKQHVLG
jgi:GAF domain-containing protein